MSKVPVRLLMFFGMFSVAALLTGCGSKTSVESVSGKVTVGGQAASGEVVFVASDGKEYKSPIGPGGNYSVQGAPKGEAKVAVRSMMAPPGGTMPAAGAKTPELPGTPTQQGAAVPAKYGKVETSGLTYTVKGGAETYDITLTP